MACSQKLCQSTGGLSAGSLRRTPLDAHSFMWDVRNVKTTFCMVNSYLQFFSVCIHHWFVDFEAVIFYCAFSIPLELTFSHWDFIAITDTNTIPRSRLQLPFPTVSTECQYNSVVNMLLEVQREVLHSVTKIPIYFVRVAIQKSSKRPGSNRPCLGAEVLSRKREAEDLLPLQTTRGNIR